MSTRKRIILDLVALALISAIYIACVVTTNKSPIELECCILFCVIMLFIDLFKYTIKE